MANCNLLKLLQRHQKQSYKTSEVNIPYWPIESIEAVKVYLGQRSIKHETINNTLNIYWK